MWNPLAFLLIIALVSLVTNLPHNAFSLTSNSTGGAVVSRTPTQPSPKLTFPTEANLASYYAKAGNLKYNIDNIFTNLSQRVPGIPNNVQVASTANLTSIAWQSLNNGTNQILLTITTDEGGNWSMPLKLTKSTPNTGNASNLQIAAASKTVYVTWQENDSSGINSVFASTSMDMGQNFKTWQLNPNGTDAREPKVSIAASFKEYSDRNCINNPNNPSCCPGKTRPPCETGTFVWLQAPILKGTLCNDTHLTPIPSSANISEKRCLGRPVVTAHRSW